MVNKCSAVKKPSDVFTVFCCRLADPDEKGVACIWLFKHVIAGGRYLNECSTERSPGKLPSVCGVC